MSSDAGQAFPQAPGGGGSRIVVSATPQFHVARDLLIFCLLRYSALSLVWFGIGDDDLRNPSIVP
ncbi:hypothetical protein DSECCO2_529870 [anaerobic digester metagenome]